MAKIGIYGFNRISKVVARQIIEKKDMELVCIKENELEAEYLAYLLKFDSIYGRLKGRLQEKEGNLICGNSEIKVCSLEEKDWNGAEIIIDCISTDLSQAKKVISMNHQKLISCANSVDIPTVIWGVNNECIENIVSCGRSEGNAVGVIAKIIDKYFGIESGVVTCLKPAEEITAAVDKRFEKNWRNGRMIQGSVIPTPCGATSLVAKVMPEMQGKLQGVSFTLPINAVGTVGLIFTLKTQTDYEKVCKVLKNASEKDFRGILGYTDEKVISADFIGCTETAIIDTRIGFVKDGKILKLSAFYDRDMSLGARILDIAKVFVK
ncbi:MAG: aldehyde dehydrogenase [Clostridia bacterium]|nr:aldehyde dehydrogenase [Clostridia bacterium]